MFRKLAPNTFEKIEEMSYLDLLEKLSDKNQVKKYLIGYVISILLFELFIFITIIVVRISLWLNS